MCEAAVTMRSSCKQKALEKEKSARFMGVEGRTAWAKLVSFELLAPIGEGQALQLPSQALSSLQMPRLMRRCLNASWYPSSRFLPREPLQTVMQTYKRYASSFLQLLTCCRQKAYCYLEYLHQIVPLRVHDPELRMPPLQLTRLSDIRRARYIRRSRQAKHVILKRSFSCCSGTLCVLPADVGSGLRHPSSQACIPRCDY